VKMKTVAEIKEVVKMIGENTLILNDETVRSIVEAHLKTGIFKDGDFSVTEIEHKYNKDWHITLQGAKPENPDAV